MTPPLADVAFLVRSPNRLAVLKLLADGARARAELVEETPASRVTVGRILHEFVGREWAVRTAAGYETTTRGRLLARELSSLRTRLRALDRLGPLVEWLPVDALDVPLEAFVDARVTCPTTTEPDRHHRRIGSVGATAERARMYSQGVTSEALAIHRSAVEDAGQRLDLVLTREAFEVGRADETLREDLRTLVDAGDVGVTDEPLPFPFVARFDDVGFVGADDESAPVGVVESDDEAVVEWADRVVDAALTDSTPVDSVALTD
jgi:predicted transcriptional regulator